MHFCRDKNGIKIKPTSWVAVRTKQDNVYTVSGSWPGTEQASVNGGPYVGAAEEGKTCHLFGKEVPGWNTEGKNRVERALPRSLKSSTSTISAISSGGERFSTLWTVRRREDQPSLWKGMMMLVLGRVSR